MKILQPILSPLAICFILLTSLSCKKRNNLDADGLPKATQTGVIMFACKVNGINWIATKKMNIDGGFYKDILRIKGSVILSDSFERFEIQIKSLGNNTSFRLNGTDGRFALYVTDKNCSIVTGGYGISESKSTDGEVIFTRIDTDKKIISGTFWCDIPTDKCGVLKITHGRFDIRYY
ncbi:hypothetical protein [Pedobacter chitinilyticus]|uniref:Lipoprotein n=1 Tax=Pedobacter chitinilyticus TaxID=2233776 RepID=A0A3S3SU14_9SPHI|nr:hypothetical protein [Pedobacter chitinilyticus]RWU07374.1 hypothetical protein DPV69_10290 [Pedobacter chitinilyticus]